MSKRGWYPKWLERQREHALKVTEQWIDLNGGDRHYSNPNTSQEAIMDSLRIYGGRPSIEEMAKIFEERGVQLRPQDYEFEIGHIAIQTHRIIRWVYCGMPTYVVDPDTAAMLALTDVDTLTIDQVRFPYPTFMVVLSPGSPLWMDDRGHTKEVRMIWVHRADVAGPCMHITPQTALEGVGLPNIYGLEPPGTLADTWLTETKQLFGEAMTELDRDAIKGALRLTTSLVMHMQQSRPRQSKPRHKVASARHERMGLPLPADWIVAPIQMPQPIRDALREGGSRIQGKLTARHVVRGHWRQQPCGPGRADRKTIWIEPFWRGAGDKAIAKVGVS